MINDKAIDFELADEKSLCSAAIFSPLPGEKRNIHRLAISFYTLSAISQVSSLGLSLFGGFVMLKYAIEAETEVVSLLVLLLEKLDQIGCWNY